MPFMTRPRLVMIGARNSTLAQSAGITAPATFRTVFYALVLTVPICN